MKKSLKRKIKQIGKVLKSYHPQKVILFGSYAWGRPTEDSDFDLLIIKKTKKKYFKRIPEARKHLYGIDHPFDILVFTPKEIKKRLKLDDFFIKDILKKGKILYEAKK